MEKILVICGPTSTGKTALALSVANHLKNVSIMSVDSRQVYQEIDIVSGKDLPENLPSDISFFGINMYKPSEQANLSDFVNKIRTVIAQELDKKRKIIIVGGTGLYLKGVTSNLSEIFVPQNKSLRASIENKSVEELKSILKEVNIDKFNKLNNSDINNPRRLVRQIEISQNKEIISNIIALPPVEFISIGLKPIKNLESIIRKRVLDRLKNGAVEEVRLLIENYPNRNLPIFTTLGIGEIIDFISGNISKDELVSKWTTNENNYAKRQMVWFKKQPDIIWYDESADRVKLSKTLADYF